MLILIHGDDIAASRNALIQEKATRQDLELIQFVGKKLTLPDLVLATETTSLFSQKKLIVIENILKGPTSKEKTVILAKVVEASADHDVIVWEDKKTEGASVKKHFSKAKILVFNFPAELFKFLDSIGGVPKEKIVSLFHDLLKKEPAELIFTMLLRQWRYMIMVKDLGSKTHELQGWQAQKFFRQASFFTLEKLITDYRSLLSIDYRIKTGQSPYPMSKLLDLFFFSL